MNPTQRTSALPGKALGLAALLTLLSGCLGGGVTGALQQAGSSTVLPIAEAWAEELSGRGIQVTVAGGGSGTGASKLCAGEIDIADMSSAFTDAQRQTCAANGIDAVVWHVAYDGLSVVVNQNNDFVDFLTVAELKHIWRQDAPAQKWSEVREGWPERGIVLYGPDSDSGTYEYFNENVLGKTCGADGKQVCHPHTDYTPSADDNVLVEGVARTRYALGHFGFAYFVENEDRLKAVPVKKDDAAPAVTPSFDTIADGSYTPLSRPLFMVTDGVPGPDKALFEYLKYAFTDGQSIVRDVGYVELDAAALATMTDQLGLDL